MNPLPGDSSKVNTILHNLRGEQFRHSQNVQRSHSRAPLRAGLTHNSPTLPFKFHDYGFAGTEESTVETPQTWSGPRPPKSWRLPVEENTSVTRASMLSLVLSPAPSHNSVPSLTLLCLKRIASMPTDDFILDVVPFVPPHLRCQLLRDTAVHCPLPNPKLYALCEPEGTADGELIIVGPTQSLRNDFFLHSSSDAAKEGMDRADWDEEEWSPSPLHTFILLSSPLSTSTFLTLPPTLTHMALINLPNALPLHRLPGICPLLVVLDLSYNIWLHPSSKEATKILDRVQWSRWTQLRKLGFRDCYVYDGMPARLNQGRWDDVEVVLT